MKKNNNIKLNLFDIDIDKNIVEKLNNKGIEKVNDLCSISRKKLNKYSFSASEIKQIIIKLQLLGLDLSNK